MNNFIVQIMKSSEAAQPRQFGSLADRDRIMESSVYYELALNKLDRLSGRLDPGHITDIVGVLADIKPGSMVKYDPELLNATTDLNLSFCWFGYDPGSIDRVAISKDPYIAEELAGLFEDGWRDNDRCRKIGKLLGYPATATDYYLRRRETLEKGCELPMILPKMIEGTVRKAFCQFNLSPEHWPEEVETYVLPLERAVRDLTPETFRIIKEGVNRHRFSGAVLSIVESQTAQLLDDDERVA